MVVVVRRSRSIVRVIDSHRQPCEVTQHLSTAPTARLWSSTLGRAPNHTSGRPMGRIAVGTAGNCSWFGPAFR